MSGVIKLFMEGQEPNFAPFRKEIFHNLYPIANISLMNQEFFNLGSSQISETEKYCYPDYYFELKRRELKLQQEELKFQQGKQQEELEMERQIRNQVVIQSLSALYATETLELLCKNLPANIFYEKVQNIDRKSVLDALRITFTHGSESMLDNECKRIYSKLFGIQSDEELIDAVISIPQFPPPNDSKIMIAPDTKSEFFPHKYIYIRDCFETMYEAIERVVNYSPVAVIGDPGIGKTTFMRYMFLKIIHESPNTKIYWEMESGQWLFYNGLKFKSGSQDIVSWAQDDVVVLIDGKLRSKYLRKQNNIILFCSPQPQNYTKLIKTYSGATFILPSWDIGELIDFIGRDENVCTIMDKFYERLSPPQTQNENELITNSIADLGSVDEYDEDERIKVSAKKNFLIEQVMYRYKLCGGKIRLLLHNQINFKLLKEQVIKSINSLSLDDLKHQECLDLQRNVPSIIYSMIPVDIASDPREFKVGFASYYIAEIASRRMYYEYSKQLNNLFAAMKNQCIGSSLVGQIFEKLVIESIISKKTSELSGRILTGVNPENETTLKFGDFVPQDYDSKDENLARFISAENCLTDCFFTPIQSNAAAVDAVYFMHSTSKLYFLQMTISLTHNFKLTHLVKLANSFGKEAEDIELVFVAPENCYYEFKKQNALTDNGQIMRRIPTVIKQSVVFVPGSVYASIPN